MNNCCIISPISQREKDIKSKDNVKYIFKNGSTIDILAARESSRLEFYPEEAPEGVSSRVEEIKNGKILAAMPMNEKGVPIIPRPGEAMMGKTPGDGCFYKFSTHYLDKAREGNIPVWIVTMPAEVQKIQNREFVRVSADYTVILRPLNEFGVKLFRRANEGNVHKRTVLFVDVVLK